MVFRGVTSFMGYQRMNLKKNTLRTYNRLLTNFQNHFGEIDLSSITSEQILTFLADLSKGTKPSTKRLRFTLLSAFFNFIRNSFEPELQNPCDNQTLRKRQNSACGFCNIQQSTFISSHKPPCTQER